MFELLFMPYYCLKQTRLSLANTILEVQLMELSNQYQHLYGHPMIQKNTLVGERLIWIET